MEKTDKKASQFEGLVNARAEGLEHIEKGSLRPHGKLWGMDVFSWYNPVAFELENTLLSFPAPILWLGNHIDIQQLFAENGSQLTNVKLVCVHDATTVEIADGHVLEEIHAKADVKMTFELIRTVKRNTGILLFTASGKNWKVSKEEFEYFLHIHQS